MQLLDKVLYGIKPSRKEEQEALKAAREFTAKLKPRFKDADAFLGGSIAKGTWLKGRYDVDIFVRFDFKKFHNKDKHLSDILEKELKKLKLKYERIHGSRDYFSVKQGKFKFEVVPILKVNSAEKAKNITDISPLHVLWVKKKLGSKLADEVRLLKAFLHAQRIYGAESYIRGFSGYACEILIVYSGSFLSLLKNSSHWSKKEIIDVEKHYKNKNPLKELNRAKTESPLILIDPVQRSRNVAAALSNEAFDKLVSASRNFLKKPSSKLFKKEKITIEKLRKKAKRRKLVAIKVLPLKGKEDVIAAKMLKAFEFAERSLRSSFRVYESGWSFEEKLFWFYLDKRKLPEYEERIGPPLKERDDVLRFKKKHKSVFIKNNRIFAKEKRASRTPEEFLKKISSDIYIKSRISSWRLL